MSHVLGPELMAPLPHGVELCYQSFGDPADETVLLVMGLGGPMIWWDDEFCERLAADGFRVVRYDNRDTGRSSRGAGRVERGDLLKAFAGRRVQAPYSLSDLAADAIGLLDHLEVDAAHVVGVSLGGMIAQTMAIEHPHRVRSLTSIMSTTGRRTVGWQHPRLMPRMLARRGGRAAYVDASVQMWQAIGSPAYPLDLDRARRRAENTFDRGWRAQGVLRQMMAVITQPDRTRALSRLNLPALVIHGNKDPMVHLSGGKATAAAIPGADLLILDGMGHDLPPALFDTLIEAIGTVARS